MSDRLQELAKRTADALSVSGIEIRDVKLIHAALLEASSFSRTATAESLLALAFGLRPDDGPDGQAWVLDLATTTLARAILAAIGPRDDAGPLLDVALEQLRAKVQAAQSVTLRRALRPVP